MTLIHAGSTLFPYTTLFRSALLAEYGLSRVAFEKTATLSGGEMRRVEICRAMSIRPALLILDEPYAGVDPVAVGRSEEQRLNSSHRCISYAVFCLKKKKKNK